MRFPMVSLKTISLLFLLAFLQCEGKLSPTFYDRKCPKALGTIRTSIRQAVSRERRMAASLLRLHFHDCFVQGCDASILLKETTTIRSERSALPNDKSVRGYEVIEAAKREVEKICPGIVSCADIVAVAARDATVAVGGPTWKVKLGRRDSTTANRARAERDLPGFSENLNALTSKFAAKGFSLKELVALSGSHTIGQAQCFTFRDRIYNNRTSIDAGFASTRRRQCPRSANNGDRNLAPLDLVTPNSFDNSYFKNLMRGKGLLHSDQVLFNGGSADRIVSDYSKNPKTFFSDFAAAMVKMGDLDPLTGRKGIIRKVCSAVK